jgi:hypothetical protein
MASPAGKFQLSCVNDPVTGVVGKTASGFCATDCAQVLADKDNPNKPHKLALRIIVQTAIFERFDFA